MLTFTSDIVFLINLYTSFELAIVPCFGTMINAEETPAWKRLSTTTLAYNIEASGKCESA